MVTRFFVIAFWRAQLLPSRLRISGRGVARVR